MSVKDKGSCLRAILTSSTNTYPSILESSCERNMPSSLPRSPTPYNDAFTRPDYSADYSTLASSSRDVGGPTSAPAPVRREPLAFAGIRHRMEEDEATKEGIEPRHSERYTLRDQRADDSHWTMHSGRHDQLSTPRPGSCSSSWSLCVDSTQCERASGEYIKDHEA